MNTKILFALFSLLFFTATTSYAADDIELAESLEVRKQFVHTHIDAIDLADDSLLSAHYMSLDSEGLAIATLYTSLSRRRLNLITRALVEKCDKNIWLAKLFVSLAVQSIIAPDAAQPHQIVTEWWRKRPFCTISRYC